MRRTGIGIMKELAVAVKYFSAKHPGNFSSGELQLLNMCANDLVWFIWQHKNLYLKLHCIFVLFNEFLKGRVF